jgi:hypothetical protein
MRERRRDMQGRERQRGLGEEEEEPEEGFD